MSLLLVGDFIVGVNPQHPEKSEMTNQLLSQQEASIQLGISTRTLQRYTKRGLITHMRIGRRVLYKNEWLDDFCKSMTIEAKPFQKPI